jgi:hypothetical protein
VDRADDIDLNSNDNMLVYENMLAVEANNFATAVRDLNDDNIRDVVVVDYNEAASETYEAENSDDEDEEDEEDDDDRDVLKVVFVGQPTTEQEEKFTKAIYDATNYSIDLDSTDDEWFEESEQGGDRIYTIKNDSYDDLDDARKAVEDYRFVRSAVINPEEPAKRQVPHEHRPVPDQLRRGGHQRQPALQPLRAQRDGGGLDPHDGAEHLRRDQAGEPARRPPEVNVLRRSEEVC